MPPLTRRWHLGKKASHYFFAQQSGVHFSALQLPFFLHFLLHFLLVVALPSVCAYASEIDKEASATILVKTMAAAEYFIAFIIIEFDLLKST